MSTFAIMYPILSLVGDLGVLKLRIYVFVLIGWSFFFIVSLFFNFIFFTSDTCFLRLCLISSMEQEGSFELLTTHQNVLRDLCVGLDFHLVEGGRF